MTAPDLPSAAALKPAQGGEGLCALLLLALAAVEFQVFSLVSGGLETALLLHGTVCLLLLLTVWFYRRRAWDARLLALAAVTTPVLGPFGPGGALLAQGLLLLFQRRAIPFDEWYASLFPEKEEIFHHALYEKLKGRAGEGGAAEEGMAPLGDVFVFGGVEQKQTALALIGKHFHPSFGPILNRALKDDNNAVRVQAASAITAIKNDLAREGRRLERAVAADPGDPEPKLQLGRHYDYWAFTGLVDRENLRDYREKALAAFQGYLELRPGTPGVEEDAARLLLRQHGPGEALAAVERFMAGGNRSPKLQLWRLECLYRLGRFTELRAAAARDGAALAEQPGFPPECGDVLALWQGTSRP